MGETRVDLMHLLEDLRDAYPGATEETILAEIVANSLDSGATTIVITTDPTAATLTIGDDGRGMRRRELARYHDIAASAKVRGAGIGFAGVGIKIGLLVSKEVLTETRRGKRHVATTWRLTSRQRAPWRWTPPAGLLSERGTAVRLTLESVLSPLLDQGFIEATLRRHFQPLFDPGLTEMLSRHYPRGVAFVLNGRRLEPQRWSAPEVALVALRLAHKRKPAAAGYLVRDRLPLPEEQRGVAVSTYGKVIKRGWDWLGITPGAPERVGGLLEVPGLAGCLTLNKADFIRAGPRGAVYLAHRKAMQEAVRRQLATWGDGPADEPPEHRRAARPIERDLHTVLADLAAEFPLLASLVEQRAGGQRRLPIGRSVHESATSFHLTAVATQAGEPAEHATQDSAPAGAVREVSATAPTPAIPAPSSAPRAGRRRSAHYELSIQFEQRPGDAEVGRLVGSVVWVNEAHPAYRRAVASRSEAYHIALAAALALAPLAVEPAKEHSFLISFLASWGDALGRRTHTRPR